MSINEGSAVEEIKLLRPKHDDILVFKLHRNPQASDVETVQKILRRIPAQVLVIFLGPDDSVETLDDESLKAHGLMRVTK